MTAELILKQADLNKIEEVKEMSISLKAFIIDQKLYSEIKGKNYAHVEAWQFAGSLASISPVLIETTDISRDKEIRWKAVVNLVDRNGVVVGRGDAICSTNESSKKSFDDYAILSMAQTRAIGKAYRNKIGWVMKLAGYEATPKEEMDQVIRVDKPKENKNVKEFFDGMQPTDEEVIEWTEGLEAIQTLKELRAFWAKVPQLVKDRIGEVRFKELKEKLK